MLVGDLIAFHALAVEKIKETPSFTITSAI